MTILAGIVMDPGQDKKPFALIGSESRCVTLNVYQNKHSGEITRKEVLNIEDNAKKVFRLSPNIIIGFAGNGFGEDSEEIVVEINKDISPQADLIEAAEFVKEYLILKAIKSQNELYSFDIIMGGYIEGKPALAAFIAGLHRENTPIQYRIPEKYQVLGFFSGRSVPLHLKEELHKRIGQGNGNITSVRLALTDYIQKSSLLFPEDCNNIVQFERIQ